MANPTKEQWLNEDFECADDIMYYGREVETDIYMYLTMHEDASTKEELIEQHGLEVFETGVQVVNARVEQEPNFYHYVN
ncbi:hypothetical protein [Bacillus phage vB_BceS-M2]|nr:hypothetical protein PBC5_078 [Bacillus phage PBC5]